MGHLVRPSDHKEPQKVAWIQCVGSRNTTAGGNSYCSTVCCMYAVKQTMVTAEHLSGDASQSIFYMDLRSHNKEFERYYQDAKSKGVRFIKSRPHHPRVEVLKNASLKTVSGSVGNFASEIEVNGASQQVKYGIAVLATGGRELQPTEYLYGQDRRVLTHQQFDAELVERATVQQAGSTVFIQCVGSR